MTSSRSVLIQTGFLLVNGGWYTDEAACVKLMASRGVGLFWPDPVAGLGAFVSAGAHQLLLTATLTKGVVTGKLELPPYSKVAGPLVDEGGRMKHHVWMHPVQEQELLMSDIQPEVGSGLDTSGSDLTCIWKGERVLRAAMVAALQPPAQEWSVRAVCTIPPPCRTSKLRVDWQRAHGQPWHMAQTETLMEQYPEWTTGFCTQFGGKSSAYSVLLLVAVSALAMILGAAAAVGSSSKPSSADCLLDAYICPEQQEADLMIAVPG